jgi:heme o synthase
MDDTLRVLYGTFKIRIGLAIMLCALAGLAVTPGMLPGWKIALLAFAVLLSSASAGAFNQWAERDLDARMARTRGRPFVTGRLKAGTSWLVVIVLMTLVPVAAVALAVDALAAAYVFLGAFVYGIVYTVWLKRRTWWNIVLGGLAGSFAVLAGSAAVTPELSPAAVTLALVLFLWTPPHFWSLAIVYREDYASAGVPMLPVVVGDALAAKVILMQTAALFVLSLVPVLFGCGWIYFAGALAGGARFVQTSIELVRQPGPEAAGRNFLASLVQLGLLLVAAIADAVLLG